MTIQETKDAQSYTKKPQQCNNCAHYNSEIVEVPASHWRGVYLTEKKKRCGLGGFAVQSSASCKLYKSKD